MGFFEKYLDEYISLIDKTVQKFPESTLNPMLLMFRQKLIGIKYRGKAMN